MCPRRIIAVLCLSIVSGACGSTMSNAADPTTQPESLALVDDLSDLDEEEQATQTASTFPAPTDGADLPDELTDRLQLMVSSLRDHGPALYAGNEPISLAQNDTMRAHFLVETASAIEAEALCDIYVSAVDQYSNGVPELADVTLSGWVLSDVGVFVDPGWESITCRG